MLLWLASLGLLFPFWAPMVRQLAFMMSSNSAHLITPYSPFHPSLAHSAIFCCRMDSLPTVEIRGARSPAVAHRESV
ncbi:hypothetical protein DFH11DRAFT_452700 [Phellopilus nigrolimitatus]|nr:hypothetical protein DFH11DRAFT_452700 [Phellopilus nigrolimitatus]